MQLRYRPNGDIHTFLHPVDVRQALETGNYEYVDGTAPIIIPKPKVEETEEIEIEKPTPRIRRKKQTEENTEASNEN